MSRGGYNRVDLTGLRFGRLEVVRYSETRGKRAYWLCRCDCGNEKAISTSSLKTGHSNSCGCLFKEQLVERNFKHGLKSRKGKHKYYQTWADMIGRCYNPKFEAYEDYGGRGITICDEWRGDPTTFCSWCDEQKIPEGYTIDRENNNGNYCPENCRFASKEEQNRNMRSNVWVEYNEERLCFKDFVEKYGVVSYDVAKKRLYRFDISPEDAALTRPFEGTRKWQKRLRS